MDMNASLLSLHYLGQFLVGFYFVFFGFWNIYHWASISEVLLKRNIPSPLMILSIAIGLQIVGGVMIIFGYLIPVAAAILILFVIFIGFILHPFWLYSGELRKQHMALFITTFTMCLGALLLLIS